jgi:N-acetylglutamate synthase-like GNAT family acetyltransferase
LEINSIQIRQVKVGMILDVRHRILRGGLPRESANFEGDDLPDTIHLAAIHEDKVVGCATVLRESFEGEPACKLRGMAVDANLQGHGAGKMLLLAVHKIADDSGVKVSWANARTPALGFYRRFGWETVGEEFVVPTAGPHFKIVRQNQISELG